MPISGPESLLYQKKNGIVIITLNRPERLNALNTELQDRIQRAFQDFRDDNEARVAILCGAGKAFCAGHDLKAETERDAAQATSSLLSRKRWEPSADIPKPTIAAIQGYAIGGGLHLAMRCDIRIAADDAEFGITETKLGMPAPWVSSLTRQLHLGHALELILWADRRMTAQRGYEIGWINKVVPAEQLMDEALSWAERILAMSSRSIRTLKKLLYQGFYIPPEQLSEFAWELEGDRIGAEETRKRIRSFVQRKGV